jgi:hypothetical protein
MNNRKRATAHSASALSQNGFLSSLSQSLGLTGQFLRSSLFIKLTALVLVSSIAVTSDLQAQASTFAGLSGAIRSESGNAIADAQIQLRHEPTGSVYSARPQANGRYSLQGLRVGGPYTLTVTSDGYQTTQQRDIYLELAKESQVNLTLATQASDVVQLEAFVVNSEGALTIFDGDRTGTGSIINNQRVQDTATVSRSLTDFARLDPMVIINDTDRGEITAAGQNNRNNSIQVDGVNLNDQFGLEANGFSAIRNPISIDTIEEFSVDIAPYDVRQSGFTGAAINAVTKSGTNEFQGTAYYYYTDDSFRAENPQTGVAEPFEETTYGFTLGGPILKDKLFFFLNYEKFDRTAQADDPGFTPDSGDIARIVARAKALGFDPGSFTSVSAAQEEEKILAKVDWNINRNHRLSVRYDTNEGQQPDFGEYSDFSSSSPETALTSHFFTDDRKVETLVAQLYSFWTDNLQSQASYSTTKIDKVPALQNPYFPEIEVKGVSGTAQNGSPTSRGEIFFGTEDSRQSNLLTSEINSVKLNFDYLTDDITYSFGIDSEESKFNNLFLQDTFGNYVYNSIADFENDKVRFGNRAFGIQGQSVAAQSDFTITGIYGQAKWRVNNQLSLIGGLRADVVQTDSSPPFAQHFFDAFGVRNDETIGGKTILAPRVSFNYAPDFDDSMQFRGGIGLFQGRAPAVYLSNSFSNNGVTTANVSINSNTFSLEQAINGTLTGSDAIFNFDPSAPRADLPPGTPGNSVNLIEKGLQLPAVWRANFAIDKKLDFMGLIATAEFVFTKADADLYVDDMNLEVVGTAPDGRTLFGGDPFRGNGLNPAFSNAYRLRNSDGSKAFNASIGVTKPSTGTWYGSASYVFGDSNDTSSVTSSTAFSNYTNRAVFNQNTAEIGTSNYEIKHRIIANLGYTFKWFGERAPTRISLLYDGRTGRPYSVTYANDVNNDGTDYNDLIYVPTGPNDPLVGFASAADQQQFFDYIAANGLDAYAGTYAPRNALRSDWVHRFDIKLVQEFKFSDRFKTEFFLDMLNVGNLLNDEWGTVNQIPFSYTDDLVRATVVNNKYVYSYANPSGPTLQTPLSRWAVQFGVKLHF